MDEIKVCSLEQTGVIHVVTQVARSGNSKWGVGEGFIKDIKDSS